ncbi:hypothetical protein I545_5849 [Mycobacterium kansasii 662]|uniref:Uncharacterized protein n=1 Tax=Mycobacterium kansasii 662 TaxID=1299326 RepID=X7YRP0_MYCKA|nr:hypothetical protein I545_5849 [Mycobacterium kansasii 662]
MRVMLDQLGLGPHCRAPHLGDRHPRRSPPAGVSAESPTILIDASTRASERATTCHSVPLYPTTTGCPIARNWPLPCTLPL